jgi:hypothetical protein
VVLVSASTSGVLIGGGLMLASMFVSGEIGIRRGWSMATSLYVVPICICLPLAFLIAWAT